MWSVEKLRPRSFGNSRTHHFINKIGIQELGAEKPSHLTGRPFPQGGERTLENMKQDRVEFRIVLL